MAQSKKDLTNYRWICSYGVRHQMTENCECRATYSCEKMNVETYLDFKEWCHKRFPMRKFRYDRDITQDIRDEFLKEKAINS